MDDDKVAASAAFEIIKVASWVVYAVLGFACVVLVFGFVLLLLGADPDVGFAQFVYGSAGRFMDPFRGLIEPTELGNGGLVAWSALVAIAAYMVVMVVVGAVSGWARASAYRVRKPSARP